MALDDDTNALNYIGQAAAAPEKLRELFSNIFPYVQSNEYYDYYYYRVYGQWPNAGWCCLFLFAALVDEECNECKEEDNHCNAKFMAVFIDFIHKLILRDHAL